MAYKVIILYRLYMPSYFLGTFTEYPFLQISLFLSGEIFYISILNISGYSSSSSTKSCIGI